MKKIKTTIYLKESTYEALQRLREIEGRFISDIADDMVFNRLAWAEKNFNSQRYYQAKINDEKFLLLAQLQMELRGGEYEKRYNKLTEIMKNENDYKNWLERMKESD